MQYLKSRPDDYMVRSSLEFIVSALNALKSKNPLTDSFLAQLEVDLDGAHHKGFSSVSHGLKGVRLPSIPRPCVS